MAAWLLVIFEYSCPTVSHALEREKQIERYCRMSRTTRHVQLDIRCILDDLGNPLFHHPWQRCCTAGCSECQFYSHSWECLPFLAFLGTREMCNKNLPSAVLSKFCRTFSKISNFSEIFKTNFPSQLQFNLNKNIQGIIYDK
jgi:hypothetical protein